MSASEWESDMKPASYCDGARYTPRSSMPRCHFANLAVSLFAASAKHLTGPSVKKKPNMPEMWPPHMAWPAALPASRMPLMSLSVMRSSCSYVPGCLRIFIVSMPAVIASGLPERVPAWYIGPAGATISMISFLPAYAPTGKPPPITLPKVERSGVMPQCCCAPPYEMRKPVITSSNTSTAPLSSHTCRSSVRKALSGTMKPELPTTPSRITPATSPLLASKRALTDSMSLYVATSVDADAPCVTPGESGSPSVATPEPAATRNESACPW
mmetsp:Transcript_38044/g.123065  ORF Transcript_38044/g.123065 Transcript_38044/m.123065 type:complete len:270 (-) Transcript_38044:556-1365(-)